jgi:hypothetical protein
MLDIFQAGGFQAGGVTVGQVSGIIAAGVVIGKSPDWPPQKVWLIFDS